MPVIIFGETAESLVHNNRINFPLDKYLAKFPTFTDFPAEFLSLPRLFIPARLSTASPSALSALSAPGAQECRQVHLLPILCCTELPLTLFLKGSGNDKWVIDRRGPFLLPDNYAETLGCSFAWCISKYSQPLCKKLSLSDFFSFPFPVSRTVKLGDKVAKSVSQ